MLTSCCQGCSAMSDLERGKMLTKKHSWLNGLGVWFSLWVREVPGSNPGWAHFLEISFFMSSFETRLLGEADQLIATCLQLNACLPLEARRPQSTLPSPRQLSPPPPSLYSVHTLPPPSPLPSSVGWHQPCCHQLISKKRLFSSGSRFVEHRVTQKVFRGHTDLNHGPIGLQPIALPLSYIPKHENCILNQCLCHLPSHSTRIWESVNSHWYFCSFHSGVAFAV